MSFELLIIPAKILFIVFFFGFCIFIHEFGHLLVAMWRGLHIEKFSVGFGKPIKKWRIGGIDYLISWLPFGGYVALPQLEPTESPQTSDGRPLPAVAPLDRTLTAIAGPLFNILFGLALACIIWVVGVEGPAPSPTFVVGHVPETFVDKDGNTQTTPESAAGLQVGDIVEAVNDESFKNGWQEAFEMIMLSPQGEVTLDVRRRGKSMNIQYNLVENPQLEGVGYPFFGPKLPTRVGQVGLGSPAERAGLIKGDILLAINGEKVVNSSLLIDRIQQNKTTPFKLTVKRGNKTIEIANVTAELHDPDGAARYLIGIHIETAPGPTQLHYPTPIQQLTDVVDRTYKTIRRLVDPKNPIGAKHMSGPLGIFDVLYKVITNVGFIAALKMIIMVNFSLAILNLLPLPILDGGHIVIGVIEMLIRRRIPTQLTLLPSYVFVVLLMSFMLYVTYYDAKRIGRNFYPKPPTKVTPEPPSSPATMVQPDDSEQPSVVPENDSSESIDSPVDTE